jgi:hypothetical protein
MQSPPTRTGISPRPHFPKQAGFVSLAAVLTADLFEVRNVGYNVDTKFLPIDSSSV